MRIKQGIQQEGGSRDNQQWPRASRVTEQLTPHPCLPLHRSLTPPNCPIRAHTHTQPHWHRSCCCCWVKRRMRGGKPVTSPHGNGYNPQRTRRRQARRGWDSGPEGKMYTVAQLWLQMGDEDGGTWKDGEGSSTVTPAYMLFATSYIFFSLSKAHMPKLQHVCR